MSKQTQKGNGGQKEKKPEEMSNDELLLAFTQAGYILHGMCQRFSDDQSPIQGQTAKFDALRSETLKRMENSDPTEEQAHQRVPLDAGQGLEQAVASASEATAD